MPRDGPAWWPPSTAWERQAAPRPRGSSLAASGLAAPDGEGAPRPGAGGSHRAAGRRRPCGGWPRCPSRSRSGSSRSPARWSSPTAGCPPPPATGRTTGRWRRPSGLPPGRGASPRWPTPFPASAGSTGTSSSGLEQSAADRITGVLGGEVARAPFGRCGIAPVPARPGPTSATAARAVRRRRRAAGCGTAAGRSAPDAPPRRRPAGAAAHRRHQRR